jgi:hypothetical protein
MLKHILKWFGVEPWCHVEPMMMPNGVWLYRVVYYQPFMPLGSAGVFSTIPEAEDAAHKWLEENA